MPRNTDEGRVQRTIAVPESIYKAIKSMAFAREISVNEMIVRILEHAGGENVAGAYGERSNSQAGQRSRISRSA
jgi:hypothetical protein